MTERKRSVTIRVSDEEADDLEARAKDADVTVSTLIRETMFGKADPEPTAEPESVDVDSLQYKFLPQGEEHLKRFPGDRHTDEQRIAFDRRVRELVAKMPEVNARRVAAREVKRAPTA